MCFIRLFGRFYGIEQTIDHGDGQLETALFLGLHLHPLGIMLTNTVLDISHGLSLSFWEFGLRNLMETTWYLITGITQPVHCGPSCPFSPLCPGCSVLAKGDYSFSLVLARTENPHAAFLPFKFHQKAQVHLPTNVLY